MNICVIGTGYVGLVTGAVFADLGNDVICVDNDKEKIELLNKGIMPIYEPGLKEIVQNNVEDRRLTFTTDINKGVRISEIIFICVGTPAKNNGETDISYIEEAAKGIGKALNEYKIIVNKSTVPIGTGDFVREIIEKNKEKDINFDVVSNPEFLREGSAIQDTLAPERIVIGAPTKEVAMKLLELYATLGRPMLITDIYSAEMIKYASNTFLAMKISFINKIANICESTGANISDVTKGIGYDSRIGSSFLNAGLGFGGSCFPKDIKSFLHTAKKFGHDFNLLNSVIEIDNNRATHFMNIIREKIGGFKGKTIGILGLSFKPDTDDMRDAKSIEIIKMMLSEGAKIKAYDPVAIENAKKIIPNIEYAKNSYSAAYKADAIAIITEWREFKLLNMEKIKKEMKRPVIFDGRNIYDPEKMRKTGFEYYSIGRR
ncbi:MAG: UDP-glucose/GDP-mannose dehydrogenase family protein [Nitrospinae bacterium]|nr:UDP-glucose/GDP-mannose dehydrogenase family protein [Nitrospinota bacterium]